MALLLLSQSLVLRFKLAHLQFLNLNTTVSPRDQIKRRQENGRDQCHDEQLRDIDAEHDNPSLNELAARSD